MGCKLLKKTVQAYQDTKLAILRKVIDSSDILDEEGFLDDGFIRAQIRSLKKEYSVIQNEIKILLDVNDDRNIQKLSQYRKRQEDLIFQMAFYASNSFNNLDYCLDILKGMETDFIVCIEALKAYKNAKHTESFQLFYRYFEGKTFLLEHYLINKTYGTLLLKENQLPQAKILLQKAVEKRPDDVELHLLLRDLYLQLNLQFESQIESSILKQLGVLS